MKIFTKKITSVPYTLQNFSNAIICLVGSSGSGTIEGNYSGSEPISLIANLPVTLNILEFPSGVESLVITASGATVNLIAW